ncbi:MAG: T9SS type A sorting domain-containing protein [Weeksellaceae bacterium]|nr:T9SS type A sorting domain-containing protein [Weeksellaceae bacterium]
MKKITFLFALVFGGMLFGQTFTETFTGLEGLPGGTYTTTTFQGTHGNTWSVGEARNEADYAINGEGIMIRRASDSYITTTLSDVATFSFQYRKAFTGATPRQLEVLVDGVQVWEGPVFGSETGADATVHTAEVAINATGASVITIKNVGSTTGNRQTVVDNITWTLLGDTEPTDPTDGLALDYVNTLTTQALYDQFLADGFTTTEGVTFQTAAGGYVRFGAGQGFTSPDIDVAGVNAIEIAFDLATFGAGNNRVVTLNVMDDAHNSIHSQNFSPTSTNYITGTASVDVSAYDQVHFSVTMTGGTGSVRFRELSITATEFAEDCLTPNTLQATQITHNSATLTWNAGGTETAWQVVYDVENVEPYEQDAVTVTSTSYQLEGLEPATGYDAYVRAVCAEGNYSNWVFVTFNTTEEPDEDTCGLSTADVQITHISPYRLEFDVLGGEPGQLYDLSAGEPGYTPNNPNFGMANRTMPYLRTSLHAGRTYDFYIRVAGQDGEPCAWVGPFTVTMSTVNATAQRATLYPNPARNIVSIEGANVEMVQIFNNTGAVISTQKVVDNKFDVNTLPVGTYVIQITDADGNVSSQQIIKQ